MEQVEDSTFELLVFEARNGVAERRERLPNDGFTDVDCDEQRDGRVTKSVALGEHVVQEDHNNTGEGQLENDEESVA